MALSLDCNTVLSFDREFEYLGEGLNYRNVDTLTVRGKMVNTPEEVQQIWTGMESKIQEFHPYTDIIINGRNFGSGRVLNYNFPQSSDATQREFNYTIELVSTGDLGILGGVNFSGISPEARFAYVKNLNENISFERRGPDQRVVNRSLSFGLESGFFDNNSFARDFARQMMSNPGIDLSIIDSDFPSFYGSGNRTIEESWDVKTQSYRFSEEFLTSPTESYFWEQSRSINSNRDGLMTASEKGKIIGLNPSTSFYESALSGFSTVRGGIRGRLLATIAASQVEPYFCGLTSDATSKIETHDRCAGTIEYDWSFSNNWAEEGCPIKSYSQSIEKGENGYCTVTENGNFRDNCGTGTGGLWANYNETQVSGRLQLLYNETSNQSPSCSFETGSLYKKRREFSMSEYDKTFSYTLQMSDDPAGRVINAAGVTGEFLSCNVRKSVTPPVHKHPEFIVPNYKEIIQTQRQSEMGKIDYTVELKAKKGVSLDMCLKQALSEVSVPSGDCTHISDANYSFTPSRGDFNLRVTYKYTGHKDSEDVLVLNEKVKGC